MRIEHAEIQTPRCTDEIALGLEEVCAGGRRGEGEERIRPVEEEARARRVTTPAKNIYATKFERQYVTQVEAQVSATLLPTNAAGWCFGGKQQSMRRSLRTTNKVQSTKGN
jgi:hypothetical protein